ncbi:hypothetical protein CROQUDRAFT_52996 [Cronartium quercuum f. sp. fusiforme G11]|uniref:CCHC-type domain-containing protein n=1 Tax=Cronartium quercuum f. sp. fusiforme G11 TaxID=708437 RepID=A0A9P6NAC4_9BASI|nr:hypothetical protein CROQUDRAFT_52996 [Cronartium quercuum f. sp. fusiforme G11]
MKLTNADGNVVLAPTIVKLVTALLRKVSSALKDARQANLRVDRLEAQITELTVKPHPLPPKPMGWAAVAGQAAGRKAPDMPGSMRPAPPPAPKMVNEFKASALVIRRVPDQTPFEGMAAAQIVQNVNLALEMIGVELDGQAIRITAVAVLRPLGDIKMYTATRTQVRWLMEQKHKWSTIADPCLITQAARYSVVLHSVPAEVQLASPEFLSRLLAQNPSITPHALHSARWLSNPEVTKKTHGSIMVNFLDKDLPRRIERGGLKYEGLYLRGSHYMQSPTQCFRCHKLGHMAVHCTKEPVCANCCGKHDTKMCQAEIKTPKCGRCIQKEAAQNTNAVDKNEPRFAHSPRSWDCPLWLRYSHPPRNNPQT